MWVRWPGIFSATIYRRRLWITAKDGFPRGLFKMLSHKKKLQLVAAFATFFLFAVGVACSGFFVAPVLTSIAVGPTATINQGATVQESAIGTYNDGSTKILGSGVQWSSSDTGFATVNSSGLVTGSFARRRNDHCGFSGDEWHFEHHCQSRKRDRPQDHSPEWLLSRPTRFRSHSTPSRPWLETALRLMFRPPRPGPQVPRLSRSMSHRLLG